MRSSYVYQWLDRQQELFIERRFDEMDLHGVQTTVFAAARREILAPAESGLRALLKVFILFDYYPGYQEVIAATDAIFSARADIETALMRTLGLRQHLEEEFPRIWASVREQMVEMFWQQEVNPASIPETNPYVLEALLDVAIFPQNWPMSSDRGVKKDWPRPT
jgi:hypothetical protein